MDVAFIPARSGSKRIPNKNIKNLFGRPLIAYTITSAIEADCFDEVIVSTDSAEIASIAKDWGAHVSHLRPHNLADDFSTDIEWLMFEINQRTGPALKSLDKIAILRPTNPLRRSSTIISALENFHHCIWADSLRAMEKVKQHPGKMWILDDKKKAKPFLEQSSEDVPTHNRPTQTLQQVWIQNASLEIIRFRTLEKYRTISGKEVLAFQMPDNEGFDLNTVDDWKYLEYLIKNEPNLLPTIKKPEYPA